MNDDVATEPPPNIEIIHDIESPGTKIEPVFIEQSGIYGIPVSDTVTIVVP